MTEWLLNEWVGNDEMEVLIKRDKKTRVMKMDGTEWERKGMAVGAAQARARASWVPSQGWAWAWAGVGVCEGGKRERQGQDGETCLVSSSPLSCPDFLFCQSPATPSLPVADHPLPFQDVLTSH